MTDRLEAARAFVAAGDALNNPEHTADMEQLREISNRVTEREKAYRAAQDALFAADRNAVETGAEPAADNAEAEAVLFGGSNGVSPPVPNCWGTYGISEDELLEAVNQRYAEPFDPQFSDARAPYTNGTGD